MVNKILAGADPEVSDAISCEVKRQQTQIELIASENFTSEAVMAAQGSVMTNKYAEGYPAKRYYGGCECVDVVEELAIKRAKELFGADHINVQPHSGSQANMAGYMTLLKPGEKIMGMDIDHGGHLTHGFRVNFSGKYYASCSYGVNKDSEQIDFDEIREIAKRENPQVIVVGASAYPRTLDFSKFAEIAKEVGAYLMADIAHIAGLVATGLHPDPVPYCDIVTTTTHKTLRGPRSGLTMCREEFAKKLNSAVFPGMQGGPLMHVIAAKAVAFKEALAPDFKTYQQQILKNAAAMAEEFQARGYRLVTGGTDNHLMLIDLRAKDITGKEASDLLDEAGITVNKNLIPFDTLPPTKTSGIRIGTPAMTTRGMKEEQMKEIVAIIDEAIMAREDADKVKALRNRSLELTKAFPLYPELD